jgi:hypothetical protein
MKNKIIKLLTITSFVFLLITFCKREVDMVTVPIKLDHNRMLVNAEIQKQDGTWRKVLLWVDTGNPDFFISESLANDLRIDLSDSSEKTVNGALEVSIPVNIRIGDMNLDFKRAKSKVILNPRWLFTTMHIDANLPSRVLQEYQVIFDYPKRKLTLAKSGSLDHVGIPASAVIHPNTGIVQIAAEIYGDSLSFALDNGASYSFASEAVLAKILELRPECSKSKGALGCANIWGWWPGEESWSILRVPEIKWGSVTLSDVGLVGLPESFPLATWYSQKTAQPVDGILGPNAYKSYRVEIDYQNSTVYFEKRLDVEFDDMDIVGLTLRPEPNGNYSIIGIAEEHEEPSLEGVEPGDILIKVDDLVVKNSTMGTVVDALRGKPGDSHRLILERNGKQFEVIGLVKRFL